MAFKDSRDDKKGNPSLGLTLTAHIQLADAARKAFAKAIDDHRRAQERLSYLKSFRPHVKKLYAEVVEPERHKYAMQLAKTIRQWDAWYDDPPFPLSVSRKRLLSRMIVDSARSAMSEFPDQDLQGILNILKRHEDPQEAKQVRQAAADLFFEEFGIRIHLDDLDGPVTPERAAEMAAKYGAEFAKVRERMESGGSKSASYEWDESDGPGKGRTQPAVDKRRAKEEELLNQDMVRLFKDLAMQLHPDREQDPQKRQEKEELMKVLLKAREEDDYSELLRLHVLLGGSGGSSGQPAFSESSLTTLTRLLREKTRSLMDEFKELTEFPLLSGIRWSRKAEKDLLQVRWAARAEAGELEELTANLAAGIEKMSSNQKAFYWEIDSLEDDLGDLHNLQDLVGALDGFRGRRR